jgi:hypothetical protein
MCQEGVMRKERKAFEEERGRCVSLVQRNPNKIRTEKRKAIWQLCHWCRVPE